MNKSMKMATVAVVAVLASLFGQPAQAQESPPPEGVTTRAEVKQWAPIGWNRLFVIDLTGPRWGKVNHCTGGPMVWRCDALAVGRDTRCTATLVMWSITNGYWFEWEHLSCEAKS